MDVPRRCVISVPEYYTGQNLFITGGGGLMGKVLVEKILRSCPGVSKIYVLIRPKKGASVEERWAKITRLPLFEKLKNEQPEALKKVELIPGDIGERELGLSDQDLQLLINNVTLIYHVAAMIQFTDSMRDALLQNTAGTYKLLEIAKRFKKLQVFVHVSTAYSHCNSSSDQTTEEILPSCQDWRIMLKLLETQPTQIEVLKEKLLCGHPNPYTWSKSLAEQVVNDCDGDFQTIIMRPAIVCSTMEDPITGWVDAANGFSAMSVGCAYGTVRVTPMASDNFLDFVPVDHAIKAFLIAPWKLHVTLNNYIDEAICQKKTEVYNCASSKNLKLTVGEIERYGTEVMEEYPTSNQVWVKSVTHTTNKTEFNVLFFIHQLLPAAAADLFLMILGKKPIALKLTKKMVNAYRQLGNIVGNNSSFPNERYMDLGKDLKDEDKAAFSFSLDPQRKREILHSQVIGFRKYYLKEDMSEEGIKSSAKRMERIKLAHRIVTSLGYLIAAWCLLGYFNTPCTSQKVIMSC